MTGNVRLSLLAAVLAASGAQADTAFEVPVVPCSLLDGQCSAAASRPVINGAWAEASPGGTIRTVTSGPGREAARRAGALTRTAMELGPRNVTKRYAHLAPERIRSAVAVLDEVAESRLSHVQRERGFVISATSEA